MAFGERVEHLFKCQVFHPAIKIQVRDRARAVTSLCENSPNSLPNSLRGFLFGLAPSRFLESPANLVRLADENQVQRVNRLTVLPGGESGGIGKGLLQGCFNSLPQDRGDG